MTDYSTEITALKKAIASGATQVRDGDRSVTYDSFEAMVKRLNWLENQSDGSTTTGNPRAGFAAFDRGDDCA